VVAATEGEVAAREGEGREAAASRIQAYWRLSPLFWTMSGCFFPRKHQAEKVGARDDAAAVEQEGEEGEKGLVFGREEAVRAVAQSCPNIRAWVRAGEEVMAGPPPGLTREEADRRMRAQCLEAASDTSSSCGGPEPEPSMGSISPSECVAWPEDLRPSHRLPQVHPAGSCPDQVGILK
jgi:hypothetical protein